VTRSDACPMPKGAARAELCEAGWVEHYGADRPIVERKIAHFVRSSWAGRRVRTRGLKWITIFLDTRVGALDRARLVQCPRRHSGRTAA